jgi:hypothetical protein
MAWRSEARGQRAPRGAASTSLGGRRACGCHALCRTSPSASGALSAAACGPLSRSLVGEFLNAPVSNGVRAGPAQRLLTEQLVVALGAVGVGESGLEAVQERSLVEDRLAAKPGDLSSGVAGDNEPPSHRDADVGVALRGRRALIAEVFHAKVVGGVHGVKRVMAATRCRARGPDI